MSDFTDLPVIQLHPTPTDAEAVAEWQEHQEWTRDYYQPIPMNHVERPWTPLRPMSCPCAMCDGMRPEAVQG